MRIIFFLTFLWQALLDDLLGLLNVFIAGDVQLEDFQITGRLSGQALGADSLWKQAPSEDHKPSVVQTSSQLVPEAAVAARYQHSVAVTARHVAAAVAGNQLGEGEDQQGREGDDGDDLADEESGGHAGEASAHHRVRGLSTSATDCTI